MNLTKYKTLATVVELESLTQAARQLNVTQSAVSHTLDSLEKDLGFTVLKRSRAGVSLTGEGERLMPAVRSLLSSAEQLEQTASAIRGLDTGTVRIGAFTSVAVHWLPGVLKEFQTDYPNVDFRLLNGDQAAGDPAAGQPFCQLSEVPSGGVRDGAFHQPAEKLGPRRAACAGSRGGGAERPLLYKRRLCHHRHGGTGTRHEHHAGAAAEGAARPPADAAADPGSETHHRHRHRGGRPGGPGNAPVCGLCGAVCKAAGRESVLNSQFVFIS